MGRSRNSPQSPLYFTEACIQTSLVKQLDPLGPVASLVSISKEYLVSMIRKYHNHKLQTNPCHLEEEPHNNHETPGRQTKQSNQLPLPHQDDCKTKRDIKNVQQNIEQSQNPTMGVTINNKSTTTEPPP